MGGGGSTDAGQQEAEEGRKASPPGAPARGGRAAGRAGARGSPHRAAGAANREAQQPLRRAADPPRLAARAVSPARRPAAGWWVYLLRCRDGSLYAGATNDLAGRVARHAAGKGARYTRSRLPVALVHR